MAAAAAAKTKKMMKAMKAMKKAMKAATTMKSTAMKARDDAAKTKKMMETKKMMKTKKTTKAKKEEKADAAKIALKEAMKPRDSPNDPFEVRLAETRRILGVWRAFKHAYGPLYRSEHRLID